MKFNSKFYSKIILTVWAILVLAAVASAFT